jgi:hypothetical protein
MGSRVVDQGGAGSEAKVNGGVASNDSFATSKGARAGQSWDWDLGRMTRSDTITPGRGASRAVAARVSRLMLSVVQPADGREGLGFLRCHIASAWCLSGGPRA